MKSQLTISIGGKVRPETAKQFDAYSAARGISKSGLLDAALDAYLNPSGIAPVNVDIAEMTAAVERLARANEAKDAAYSVTESHIAMIANFIVDAIRGGTR